MRRILTMALGASFLNNIGAKTLTSVAVSVALLSTCSLLSCSRNAGGNVGMRVPVHCGNESAPSCGEDISLEEAKASFEKVRNGETFFTATDHNVCASPTTTGFYYYWAPVERYVDGKAALELLQKRASTGLPFVRGMKARSDSNTSVLEKTLERVSLDSPDERVIVESNLSTDTEQHLALCDVKVVGDAVGPPTDCVTVAIITPTETWLRGGDSPGGCYAMATFRNSGTIDITFDVNTRGDPQMLSNALLRTLKYDLELQVDEEVTKAKDGKVESIYLRSAGSLRNSKILPRGWREALDFDIFLSTDEGKIAVRGIAKAMVCRQAVGTLINYTGLDDSQRSLYANKFDSAVNEAIKSVCQNYRQQDAKTIFCSQ